MKRWWLLLALFLSVGLNLGILATLWVTGRAANATSTPTVRPIDTAWGARVIDRMADELRLEGARREQFKDIQRAFLRAMVTGRRQVARRQVAFYESLAADTPDPAEIKRRAQALVVAQGNLEKALAENVLRSRALLEGDEDRTFLRILARLQRHLRGVECNEKAPAGWDRPGGRRRRGRFVLVGCYGGRYGRVCSHTMNSPFAVDRPPDENTLLRQDDRI